MKGSGASHALLYGLMAAMVFLWSANFSIGKVALREFPPLLAAGLRLTFAAAFILPAFFLQSPGRSWDKRDAPYLLYLGVLGVAMNQLCFVIGLSRTSAAHSALIMGLTPIFVLLFATMIKQERLTIRKAAGMLIALGGVTVLSALSSAQRRSGKASHGSGRFLHRPVGDGVLAVFTVMGKKATVRH